MELNIPDKEKQQTDPPFTRLEHLKYLYKLDSSADIDAIGHYTNEHLKLPGAYWCIGAIKLLDGNF